jgi:glycerate 2-kinase
MARILVAPDKFKGCLTAPEVAAAIAEGILLHGSHEVALCPISDGGDGFTETMRVALGGTNQWLDVHDALGRPLSACVAVTRELAVLEMASASGIALLRPDERDPWTASTVGTGEMMAKLIASGYQKLLIGIGGSATNDGGVGMAQALGFTFLDANHLPVVDLPRDLLRVVRIVPPEQSHWPEINVACDVTNPLLGPHGATQIYGPQKGITAAMIAQHEARLAHLVKLVQEAGLVPHAGIEDLPGSGAAGGLGYGLQAFLGAELQSGFSLVSAALDLAEKVSQADWIVTGEGRLDASSLQGKAPAALAQLAKSYGKPVIGFAGASEIAALPALEHWFEQVIAVSPTDQPLEVVLPLTRENLVRAAAAWSRGLP